MKITWETNRDIVVFRIEGEVNSYNSAQLRDAFQTALAEGRDKVVIESSALDYVDSSGLAAVTELLVRVKPRGGAVNLCGLGEKVRKVLQIAKLDKLFGIYDTLEEALGSF